MDINKDNSNIENLLRSLIKEKKISIRELSRRTAIDTAIISKILNGKRKVTVNHLKKFSEVLDVSHEDLMRTAGFLDQTETLQTEHHLEALCKQADPSFTTERMLNQLAAYEEISLTDGGKQIIDDKFNEKITSVGSAGKLVSDLKHMFYKFQSGIGTKRELILFGAALLYFINPIDVLPDYIFPFGYLDDTLVVHTAMMNSNK
ncbi:helix-turn-helix domain-containing protein [Terribacillus saccharophilus]|uniref:helix-turn-helix domain-containing protein n=1 Tax=Terribacillus saccharophilus TaxID=361277 RepID=UPI000C9AF2BA|nr:helix-turn-helix domain-containing protein [Terribacillus goriensis]